MARVDISPIPSGPVAATGCAFVQLGKSEVRVAHAFIPRDEPLGQITLSINRKVSLAELRTITKVLQQLGDELEKV